jgi:hypothetical protein
VDEERPLCKADNITARRISNISGSPTSHKPMSLHGLLHGELHHFIFLNIKKTCAITNTKENDFHMRLIITLCKNYHP